MAHHFLVGVGFLAGPFIIGRHFPSKDDAKEHQRVCDVDKEPNSR